MAFNIRPYQKASIDCAFREWENHRSTLIVLPTGLGKTVVIAGIVAHAQPHRALILAHREELIFQALDKVGRFTGLSGEIEMGKIHANGMFGNIAPFVVSTVQTQCSGGDGGGRMTKFIPTDFDYLIIDEAHHATSSTYQRIMAYYSQNPKLKILGVTATPDRADEEALGKVFDSVAYNYEIIDAIHSGWLVPIEQQMVTVQGLDFSGVRTTAGDLNQGDLSAILDMEQNLQGIAVPTVEICKDKRAIVFAATVEQAERLSEILNRYRPDKSDWVCGKTPKEDRRRILSDFKDGKLQYVVNVGVLTEGFDDSGVEVVIMARPTKSRALYAQMAGRGIRPHDSVASLLGGCASDAERVTMIRNSVKPRCLIVDFVGNAGRHKLCTTADILGGNYEDDVVESAVKEAKEKGIRGEPVDMTEELAKAQEKKVREMAKRAGLQARAKFLVSKIDPFNAWDITPHQERGWDRGKRLSEGQRSVLLNCCKVNPDEIPYHLGRQLIDEYFKRVKSGMCSLGQANLLKKNGIRVPLKFAEAKRAIDEIAQRQGWGR